MIRLKILLLVSALLLAACTLGPDYRRPEVVAPPAFREGAPWKEATPADALPREAWWEIYGDPVLNELQLRAGTANQSLKAAVARVEQARAVARIVESDLLPRIDLDPAVSRGRTPDALTSVDRGFTSTVLSVPFDLSWEVDLWGRVRRSVEAATAEYQATAADLENFRLTLHADVGLNYFALRALDAEIDLLQRTVELRRQNLRLVDSLFRNGQVSRLDVARAETEVATAEADLAGLQRRRAGFEHAIAVLVGESASVFSLPPAPLDLEPPAIAAGLPSSLLERRPDIATAERLMIAANAHIGVAKAAFFPAIRLTGSAGWASDELSTLFDWGNRAWALGPFVSLPVFDAGRNRAGLDGARAAWEESVALYRQQVLVAFSEVEDALSDLQHLTNQAVALQQAVASARDAAELSGKRYRAGLVSYLEVVVSERTALLTEQFATQVQGQRLQASVSLIKALGGGWEEKVAGI